MVWLTAPAVAPLAHSSDASDRAVNINIIWQATKPTEFRSFENDRHLQI